MSEKLYPVLKMCSFKEHKNGSRIVLRKRLTRGQANG